MTPTEADALRALAATAGSLQAAMLALADGSIPEPIPPVIPVDPIPPTNPNPPVDPPAGVIWFDWRGPARDWHSRFDGGGLTCERVLIFATQVPIDAESSVTLGRFSVSEYPPGPPTKRQVVLSRVPGSFDLSQALAQEQGTSAGVSFGVGFRGIVAGDVLYMNFRTYDTDKTPEQNAAQCPPGFEVDIVAHFAPAQ